MQNYLISKRLYKDKLEIVFYTLTKELDKAIRNNDEKLILTIENYQSAFKIAYRMLYEMPCAYNVEKVVAEMNKYPHGYLNVETIYDLTEIVRNGGNE